MQTTTCKRAACGLAAPPYQRAKPIYLPSNATDASRGRPPAFFETRNPRKALHLESKSTAYTPKRAGSALVIGKNVLIMPVTAAKINQSSMMPAFDQTRVQRIIHVSTKRCCKFIRKGSSSVSGPKFLGIRSLPRCPPCMTVSHRRTVGCCQHF